MGIRDDDWDTAWPGQQQQHHQQHHPSSSSSMTGQHQHAASATSAAVATATSSSSFNSKDSNVFVDSSSSCPHSAGAALPLLSSSNGETRESLQLAPTATISSTSSIIPSSSQDGVQEEENYHGGNGNEEEEEGEEDKEERGGNFNNNCNEDVFQFHAPPPPQPDIGIGKLLDGTEGTASSIPIPAPCSAAAAENKCNGGSSSSSSSPSCTSAPQSESSANHHQYSHHHHHHFYHQQQQRPFSMSAIIEGLQPPIASDPTDAKAVRYLVLHVGLARVLGDINYLANSAIVEGDRGELIERAREMLDDWISKLGETMMPEDVVDLGNTISGGGGSNRQLSPASWKDGRGSLGAWGIKHSFSVMYHTASILLTRLNEGRIDDRYASSCETIGGEKCMNISCSYLRCAPSATALTRILDYMPLPSKDNEGLGYCYYVSRGRKDVCE